MKNHNPQPKTETTMCWSFEKQIGERMSFGGLRTFLILLSLTLLIGKLVLLVFSNYQKDGYSTCKRQF